MAKARKKAARRTPKKPKARIVVNSKRYGKHTRSPRGTFKPAVLNEEMELSKERLLQANQPAKLIFDAIRHEHKDGTLWPELLSIFRKQIKAGKQPHVRALLKLDCSIQHPMSRLLTGYHFSPVIRKNVLHIQMELDHSPEWKKSKGTDGFQIRIIVIFPDFVNEKVITDVTDSDIFPLTRHPAEFNIKAAIPAHAKQYAVFFKLTGCTGGVVYDSPPSRGMVCVLVGEI